MNNRTLRILVPIIFFGIFLLHAGCSKMNDIQQEFVGDGEVPYTAKPDSVYTKGGINRIEINWTIFSDPKIAGYKIFWNNRKDSLVRSINRSSGVEYIKELITDIEEGTYNFDIYTFDKIGNTSIKMTVIGKVYGERYEAQLLPRSYQSLSRVGNNMNLEWMPAEDEYIGGEITYENQNGEIIKIPVTKESTKSVLPLFPVGSSFELTSVFKPNSNAIDAFYKKSVVLIKEVEVNWKPYISIFGHLGSLMALDAKGILVCYVGDGNGGFKNVPPVLIDYPWHIFDAVLSYKGNIVGKEIGYGFLYRYPVDAAGVRYPNYWRLGPGGWEVYTTVFTSDNFFFALRPSGQLLRFPLIDNSIGDSNMGDGVVINGDYSKYNKIEVSGNNLMCRDEAGKLWRIPVSLAGVADAAVQIAEGWDDYVMISHIGLDLLVKNNSGELWRYPVDENGNLGEATKITIVSEGI